MKRTLLFMLFLFLISNLSFGQGGLKVSGKVIDNNGDVVIGANVSIKSLKLGGISDLDGKYSFEVPSDLVKGQSLDLTASCVSYKTKIVKITLSGSSIVKDFTIDLDAFKSEEVVVTGIASKTSKSVAEVSVARIQASDLTSLQPYTGFSQLVTGKIPGVQVQTASGNVAGGWKFLMRGGGGLNGDGQPIIYLDGVRIDYNEVVGFGIGGQGVSMLSTLNPNDIENIEILKGPSAAAMYGTSGSNGVVLITTKSGKLVKGSGKPYSIEYQYTYGSNNRSFEYDNSLYFNGPRINALLKEPGLLRENSVAISGGTPMLKYYTSFGARDEHGLIGYQNSIDRKSVKVNVSSFPSDNLSLQIKTTYNSSKIRQPKNDNNIYGWMLNALAYYPAYMNCDSAAIAAFQDWDYIDQFVGSGNIVWKPIANMEITGGIGMDYNSLNQDYYNPWGYKYGSTTTGERALYNRVGKRYTYDFNARYHFNFLENLNWTTIVGSQLLERKYTTNFIDILNFNHPELTTVDLGALVNQRGSSYSNAKEAGIFWENNLSYDNTYFGTLAIRRDYASAFGYDAPAITYPKASLAIRLDRFGILPDDINMAKVRVSYGESGQLPGQLDGVPLTWTAVSGTTGVGIVANSIGNTKIEPERIKEIEFGLDMEFLNMFSLEFTYYSQNANNSIVYSRLAPSIGFGSLSYPFNIGSIKNHGFETMLQINPFKTPDYDLNLSLILNYQTSMVENLGETTELVSTSNIIKPGYKKWEFYDYVSAGPKFNAAGLYSGANQSATKVDLGNPLPDYSGSFSVNFKFLKNFNLYAFGEFGLNNKIYSYTIYRMIRANSYLPTNRLKQLLGILKPTGSPSGSGITLINPEVLDPTIVPLTPGTPEYLDAANKLAKLDIAYPGNFMYDADYFTIREVSLSYDFTELMQTYIPNNYVNNFVLGLSARNLFRSSKYDLDYEVNYSGGRTNTLQSDLGTLPQPRTFSFWARLVF